MARHPDPAVAQAISDHLQTDLLPLADDLLRRVQAAAIVLRDVDRAGMPQAAADRLEIVVVLLGDAERGAEDLQIRCG